MRIVQIMPTISFGDAVSNDAVAIRKLITEKGFETGIYAENIDPRFHEAGAVYVRDMAPLQEDDILIYHGSTGTALNFTLPRMGGRQMMIYHNITPPDFFRGYSPVGVRLTESGYKGIRYLADAFSLCVADSDYNRHELRKMGYECPIDVCPIMIPFGDYDQEPDGDVLRKYQGDGWTNLLFVGRIAPNKRQQDIILAFDAYRRSRNPKSRLFLVGSSSGMEKYEQELKNLVGDLGLENQVIFPGHISFQAILAYYRLADVFVCMSVHEGFCVPLAEAMYFGKPIVARAEAAVPETLGEAGILVESGDPTEAANAIDRALQDQSLREKMKKARSERLEALQFGKVSARMWASIEKMM